MVCFVGHEQWRGNEEEYDVKAKQLANEFLNNFKKYENGVSQEILDAAPKG
jgi:ATP-dependent phosphoenolpyruvate carboxykinase